MNASPENHKTISFACAFVNVTIYRDYQALVLNMSACTLNVLFALSAIVFNSIVIFVICKTRSLHTPSNILLCGLAASDLAVGCAVQPLYIAMKVLEIQTDFSSYCRLRLTSETVTMVVSGASFLTLTSIGVERFLALYLHLRYKAIVTSKRTMTCLVCSWLLSSAWALSRFWLNVRSFATTTGSVIIVYLLINTWAYLQVFRLVKRHKTQIKSVSNHLTTSWSSVGDISKYTKTVITMVVLLVILIGSYAAFVGVTNALAFGFGGRNRRALFTTYTLLSSWIFFTSSLNPVLYCWRLAEIRKAVRKLIFKQNQ